MKALKIVLTLFPFVWSIGMIPFVNQVKPFVLGLPFLAFWLLAGVLVAFACLLVIDKIDCQQSARVAKKEMIDFEQ